MHELKYSYACEQIAVHLYVSGSFLGTSGHDTEVPCCLGASLRSLVCFMWFYYVDTSELCAKPNQTIKQVLFLFVLLKILNLL